MQKVSANIRQERIIWKNNISPLIQRRHCNGWNCHGKCLLFLYFIQKVENTIRNRKIENMQYIHKKGKWQNNNPELSNHYHHSLSFPFFHTYKFIGYTSRMEKHKNVVSWDMALLMYLILYFSNINWYEYHLSMDWIVLTFKVVTFFWRF